MTNLNLFDKQTNISLKAILPKYLISIAVGYLTAFYTAPIWSENILFVHAIIELFCIFIALSTFLIVWNSYKVTLGIFRKLGFGLLSVSIFYSFHTYLTAGTAVSPQLPFDLTIRFWMLGKLAESVILLDISLNLREVLVNKWKSLLFVLTLSFGVSFIVIYYPGILPVMTTEQGIATQRLLFNGLIVIICILCLHSFKSKLNGENGKTYKYIFMALLYMIPSQIVFIKYDAMVDLSTIFAHILRVVYYYYLYKAIYVSAIELPYKKLAEAYSEQENANTSIKEISDTLNTTLDALPIGILKYERDSRITYMNKRLEEILACDRNDFCGSTLEEFNKAFTIVDCDKSTFQMIIESDNDSINAIINLKNQKDKYVKLSLTSQSIGNGVLIYINEVKSQQEIKSFHLQTQTILNAVSNAILIIDKSKKIILHNEAFQKACETKEVEIIGMDLDEFNSIIDYKGKSLEEMLTKRDMCNQPLEIAITTLKGNRLEMLNYMASITNVEDEIIGAISICTDITEIKKQQHNMQQQEKLALVGQMAAGIVHEIKNPLATIKGLSQLITAKTKIDKVKQYSIVIDSAIDDVTHVVNDFLNFAKPNPTIKVRTSINKIVESMQLIVESQCYTKNIKSKFYYSSCPMEITADEIKIKQVILNITENAIAAMEMVEIPELKVNTYYDTDLREGVIKISDNGIGMSSKVISQLGTPFFTTKEKGTGLGLGISYQIIHEHKGRIEVESEEGKGTIFKIIFTQIDDLI